MAAVSEIHFDQDVHSPLGFRLTGGSQFAMPLTVFEVAEGGRAHRAGVRLGDVLLRINGMNAASISLEEAHRIIADAGNNVKLSISNLDDQELTETEELIKASVLSAGEEDTDTEVSHEILASELSAAEYSETQKSEASVEAVSEIPVTDNSAAESEILLTDNSAVESERPLTDNSAAESELQVTENSVAEPEIPLSENSAADSVSKSAEVPVSHSESNMEGMSQEQFEEEQYVDVRSLPLRPPQPAPPLEKAQRRCWHPVMWETSPPPDAENANNGETPDSDSQRREYPHKQRIRNLRRLMAEGKVKPTQETLIFFLCNKFAVSEDRHGKISIPNNSVADETDHTLKDGTCHVECYTARQLRSLQRQAEALAQLPSAVRAALDAVTDHIEMLLREPTPTPTPSRSPTPESDLDKHTNYSQTSAQFIVVLKDLTIKPLEVEEMDRPALVHGSSSAESDSPMLSDCSVESVQQKAKQQKMEILNKSWPWAAENKPIYKIADHYEAVYAKCINNKVKWLEGKISEEQLFTEKLKIRR